MRKFPLCKVKYGESGTWRLQAKGVDDHSLLGIHKLVYNVLEQIDMMQIMKYFKYTERLKK